MRRAARRALRRRVPARWRARALDLLTRNLGLKLVSLLLALTVWAWVQTERVVQARVRVPVTYEWPDGLVQVDEVRPNLVVTVSGPQGLVRRLEDARLGVRVDLRDAQEGPVSIDFTERGIEGLPAGLEVVQISPPAIDVVLDRRMTREVQVRPAVIGEPAPGWRKVSESVEPATVEITGPQSLVRNIAEVSTDIVDISGIRTDLRAEVRLAIKERTVRPTTVHKVVVRVDVEPETGRRTLDAVPVEAPRGWRVAGAAEARVLLEGPRPVLDGLDAAGVRLRALPPEGAPAGRRAEARFERDGAGGLSVVLPAEADGVRVLSVEPDSVTLEPAP